MTTTPGAPSEREAIKAWQSVQHAHRVGDPHGFEHHAARLTAALAALRPPAPESGELEKLREYHKAVEEMTCVWAGTDRASSIHPYRLDECDDDEDRAAWDRFIEARDALRENGNG